jgi:hypothetical protein
MKAVVSIAFAIASSIGACIAAASLVVAEPELSSFADLRGPDLWTTTPVHVEKAKQRYERLPPVLSTYVSEGPPIRFAKASGNPSPQ